MYLLMRVRTQSNHATSRIDFQKCTTSGGISSLHFNFYLLSANRKFTICTKTQCIFNKKNKGKQVFVLPSFGGFHQKPLYWSLLIRIPPCLFNLKRRCRSVSCKLEQRACGGCCDSGSGEEVHIVPKSEKKLIKF